jgi:Domain of unknown function (DUF4399)
VKEIMMRTFIVAALALAASFAALPLSRAQTPAVSLERTPSPAGAEAYIISPKDGAKVHAPVLVQFGLKGMGVAPAGVKMENTGHHHLLIDTETTLHLSPGKHTLQLLLGDQNHIPHNPPVMSKKITITVIP